MFRYRSAQKRLNNIVPTGNCPFCHIEEAGQIIRETELIRITKAKYDYELWEFRNVTDHLLITPKRHVASLVDLKPEERQEIMDIMCEFEAQNYNVYARAKNSVQRTETHQHTHLIKTDDKHANGAIYINKPYTVVRF